MKKLLLLLVAMILSVGYSANAANVVESFESFTDAAKTWLPTAAPATATNKTSTITGLIWEICNVSSAKNTGKIYMTFKKDVSAYMKTDPGIACKEIKVKADFAGASGGMDIYVDDKSIAHQDVTAAGTFTFTIPEDYRVSGTKFKIVNTTKTGSAKGNQISVMSITFVEAETGGVATPTISEKDGWVAENTSVKLACSTENAVIYYTTDNNDPYENSAKYEEPIVVDKDMTVKAVAYKDGVASKIATASYKVIPFNSAEYPLTVTQTKALIDAEFPQDIEVYAAGTITEITEIDVTKYYNATYLIKDEAGAEMTVYRGKYLNGENFTSVNQIAVNDKVVVKGMIKKYTDGTYEFDANNQLVSVDRPSEEKTLGDIVAIYGEKNTPIDDNDELTDVEVGTAFSFSAENAESVTVTNFDDEVVASGTDSAEWTPAKAGEELLTVTAVKGDETKSITFAVEVVEKQIKQPGEVKIVYGGGLTVAEDDEVSVEVGTQFFITCENATNIKIEKYSESEVIANVEGSNFVWMVSNPFEQDFIYVTASNEVGSSELGFYLTVTEPVVPESVTYVKVKSQSELVAGKSYILVGATDKAAKVAIMGDYEGSKYFNAVDVTENGATAIKDSYTINASMDVCEFVIEDYNNAYALKLGDGKYIAVKSYSTSSSVDMKTANLGDKDKSDDITRFNITIATDGEATIENGNKIKLNTGSNPWRFKTYYTGQSPVYLYVKKDEVPAPTFVEKPDEKMITFTSTKGELHVLVVEYDENDEVVNDNAVPASIIAKADDGDSDHTWTNKVADEGVEYVVNAPETVGNYYIIRAKSIYNDIHSEEVQRGITSEGGIISGVESVMTDDVNAPVEYFNLQGVRVDADRPGLYIRRQGNSVSKQVIR